MEGSVPRTGFFANLRLWWGVVEIVAYAPKLFYPMGSALNSYETEHGGTDVEEFPNGAQGTRACTVQQLKSFWPGCRAHVLGRMEKQGRRKIGRSVVLWL